MLTSYNFDFVAWHVQSTNLALQSPPVYAFAVRLRHLNEVTHLCKNTGRRCSARNGHSGADSTDSTASMVVVLSTRGHSCIPAVARERRTRRSERGMAVSRSMFWQHQPWGGLWCAFEDASIGLSSEYAVHSPCHSLGQFCEVSSKPVGADAELTQTAGNR